MSRVTPGGHHISGAAEPDLVYVAGRAAAAAARARATLVSLIAAADNVVELVGPASPAARLAWRAAAVQAGQLALLRMTAESRERDAGLAPALDDIDRYLDRALGAQRYAIGEFVDGINGRTAVALLGVLVDRDDDDGGDLAIAVSQQPVDRFVFVSPGTHATRVTTVPPPAGETYYVLRRTI